MRSDVDDASRIAGWHGKLPALGDFANRRIDGGFIEPWDAWLAEGMLRLRLAPAWPGPYLASPAWRFLLLPEALPGDAGASCWAGVLMPSVDRVGRYYPLTIALPLPQLPGSIAEVEALWNWLVRLDEAAADALHDDWSIEDLENELHRLPLPPLGAGAAALARPAAAVQALSLGGWPHAGLLLAAQAAAAWTECMRGLAFWAAQPDCGEPRLLCSRGLDRTLLVERLFGVAGENRQPE